MEIRHSTAGKTMETAAQIQGSDKSNCFENAKNNIADKLHRVAAAIGEKATDQDPECDMAQYGKQAS